MVIDIHAHYPKSEVNFPRKLVDALPTVGIDKIVLFSAGADLGHVDNSEILAAAQRFPDQIIPFAFVELGKDSAESVDRYHEQGFRGFKITNPRSAYDDEAYFPIYERMEKTGMPLLAHTGILMRFDSAMRVNSNWMRPICLDPVVRAFPRLNVIGAHLGAPWHDEASMMARVHPNYYVDLTGAAWGGWRVNKSADFYRNHFFWPDAWDKVLFGTDILSIDDLAPAKRWHDKIVDEVGLPEDVRKKVYAGTAAKLLKL